MLVGEEAAVVLLTETSAPVTERAPLSSSEVSSAGRFVDVLETELCWEGAEPVSRVGMEVVVTVFEMKGVEGLKVVGITEAVQEGSDGVEVLVTVEVGASVSGPADLGSEAFLSLTVTLSDVVVAAVGFTESVHISVSVLDRETVTGTELEIVGTVEVVVAVRSPGADGAATGLGLVGVFVSAS